MRTLAQSDSQLELGRIPRCQVGFIATSGRPSHSINLRMTTVPGVAYPGGLIVWSSVVGARGPLRKGALTVHRLPHGLGGSGANLLLR